MGLQLNLQACDDGVPVHCITRPLTITVLRDTLPPTFQPSAFLFTMDETELPSYIVGQVRAVDSRPLVCIIQLNVHVSFHKTEINYFQLNYSKGLLNI